MPAIESHEQWAPSGGVSRADALELIGREAGRLLDEHGFARLQARDRELGMAGMPRRHCDHVHAGIAEELLGAGRAGEAELLLRRLRRPSRRARDAREHEAGLGQRGHDRSLRERAGPDQADPRW